MCSFLQTCAILENRILRNYRCEKIRSNWYMRLDILTGNNITVVWKWSQQVLLKCWYQFTKLHGVTSKDCSPEILKVLNVEVSECMSVANKYILMLILFLAYIAQRWEVLPPFRKLTLLPSSGSNLEVVQLLCIYSILFWKGTEERGRIVHAFLCPSEATPHNF